MMKIKLNLPSEESKELLNLLYRKLLTKEPKDKSDLGFCRAYILYQKWKTIRKRDEWEKMDEIMYKLYDHTPEYIKTNETLKRILVFQSNSVLDTVIHITEDHVIISEEYFKFISSMKIQEEDVRLPETNDIEMSDPTLPCLETDNEDEEIHKAYNSFVKSMSALSQAKSNTVPDECITIKSESEDDDCQIVADSAASCDSEESNLIHEILDDMEIMYIKKKDRQSATQKEKSATSFLDSIKIPEHSDFQSESAPPAADILTRQTSVKNVITISASTSTSEQSISTSLYSPVQNPDALKTSITVPNLQERGTACSPLNSKNDVCDVNMEINTDCISGVMEPLSCIKKENPSKQPVRSEPIKTVTNTETQTDDFSQIISASDLKSCQCNNKVTNNSDTSDKDSGHTPYYYYGLVTPPSDQPPDEHSTAATDDSTYSNVYANNIVRSHDTQDETDSSAKTSEGDYLLPTAEESNLEDSMKNFPTTSELDRSVEEQGMCMSSETVSDSDFKLRTKEGHSPKCSSDEEYDEDDCMNQYNSISDKMVTTEETIVDRNEKRESTSQNFSIDSTAQTNNLDLIGESSSTQETSEKLPDLSTFCNSTHIFRFDPYSLPDNPNGDREPYNPVGDRDSSPSSSPSKSSTSFKIVKRPRNIPCTSTHSIDTSDDCPSTSSNTISNAEIEPTNTPCPSPDITSTSTDIQDFNKKNTEQDSYCVENRGVYEYLNNDVTESDDSYIKENYGSEGFSDYSEHNVNENFVNNENVSQSNLKDGEGIEEIFIEDPILMNNGDELSYIMRGTSPVGANIDICIDNHSDESSVHSDVSSPINNLYGYEIEQPQTIKEIEKVDGEVSKHNHVPSSPSKESKVDKEKVNMSHNKGKFNNKINTRKVKYTCEKVKKPFLKNPAKCQSRWTKVKDRLDEMFSERVLKVNGVNSSVNPDTNLNTVISEDHTSQISTNCVNNAGEVNSPAYEEMDDFRVYYEANKNNSMLVMSSPHKPLMEDKVSNKTSPGQKNYVKNNSDKAEKQSFPKHLKTVRNNKVDSNKIAVGSIPTDNDVEKLPKAKPENKIRRSHIAFAENVIDSSNIVSHSPTENITSVPQSILKKSSSSESEISQFNDKRTTRLLIPLESMNLESLALYGVKPNDPCLQACPCVPIERLGASEIEQWQRMSEETRKYSARKQAQLASTRCMIRVDYYKHTPQIDENDMVRYNTPEGTTSVPLPYTLGHWRSNSNLHTKSTGLDEGLKSNDLPHAVKENGKRKRQGSISDSPQAPKRRRGRPRKKV